MIIIKLLLTLISFYLFSKSFTYFRKHPTPLAISITFSSIILFTLTWFDEVTSIEVLDNIPEIHYINLNFVLIAILFLILSMFMWIKLQQYIKGIESEITKLVRMQALDGKKSD